MALCIFSRNAQESSYVKNEIIIAFSNNKKILSFKIDDFEPRHKMEFFLKNYQWVIGCPNPENHLNEVVGAVKSILGIEEDMKKDTSLTEDDLPSIDKDIAQNKKVYLCYEEDNQDIAESVCSSLEEFNFKC